MAAGMIKKKMNSSSGVGSSLRMAENWKPYLCDRRRAEGLLLFLPHPKSA